jgi:hypothetical protein
LINGSLELAPDGRDRVGQVKSLRTKLIVIHAPPA